METIIIFANGKRISDLQNYTLSWKTVEEKIKEISVCDEKKFIIAYDKLENNILDSLVDNIYEKSNVFILHHTLPSGEFLNSLKEKLKGKNCPIEGIFKKQHDDIEYKKIQEIDKYGVIQATKNLQELEKVFDELNGMLSGDTILEAKLELLHNCLVPESIPQTLDSSLSSYNKAYSKFNTERTGKSAFDKEYIDALTKFRNVLLDF